MTDEKLITLTRKQATMLLEDADSSAPLDETDARWALASIREQLAPPIIEPTAGPWELDADDPLTIRTEGGLSIADCFTSTVLSHATSRGEAEANARLICAAPDMWRHIKRRIDEGTSSNELDRIVARVRGEADG